MSRPRRKQLGWRLLPAVTYSSSHCAILHVGQWHCHGAIAASAGNFIPLGIVALFSDGFGSIQIILRVGHSLKKLYLRKMSIFSKSFYDVMHSVNIVFSVIVTGVHFYKRFIRSSLFSKLG